VRRRGLLAAGAAVLAIASGCSVVKAPERPTWRAFALEAPAAASPAARAEGPVVVVAAPESGAGYATRRMAYSRGGGELEYFAEHRWADTPARMLGPLLADALTRTGAFSAVAAAPTRVAADVTVETEVRAFRQELDGESARFRASLRVTVVPVRADAPTRTRTFEAVEPMAAAGPVEGVAAANRTVARLLGDAAAFCAEVAGGP